MERKEYNGWTNYETWAVALWWDNERGSQRLQQEMAAEFVTAPKSTEEDAISARRVDLCRFAEWIKETTEENAPDLGASLYSDLLGAALSEVNWYEIAENWADEFPEEEEAANG